MSLDTKDKLLTGRKFLKMTSRPGFFNSGKTKASFQILGKHPDCNELHLLMIIVRTGRRSSHLLTSADGIGSRGQDLRAEFWISCLTSRTDSIVKVENGGTVSVGRASHRYRGGHGFESRLSLDFFRLLLSNCLNWKIYCDDHSSLSSTTAVQI